MRASLVLVLFASMTAACSTSERPGLLRDDGGTVYFDGFIGPQDVVDVPGAEGGRADGTTPTGDQPGVDVPRAPTRRWSPSISPAPTWAPAPTRSPARHGDAAAAGAVGPDAGGPTDGGGPSADMGAGVDAGPDAMSPSDSGADAGERCTPGVTRQCMGLSAR
ncbi:MAG: hypothetical protein U0325_35765 [Polyangiales bacterium]